MLSVPETKISLMRCPCCDGSIRKELYLIVGSTLYECAQCGLRYLDPCLSPEAMRNAYASNDNLVAHHSFHDGYYDYGDLYKKSQTRSDFLRALELLEKRLPVGKRHICDIGFGNGFFLALARERGWDIDGIDSSLQNVKTAKQKFSLDLKCEYLETYNPQKTFDVITFWDVIEHLANPHAALKKARRMLAPDGYLIIAVPNDRSLLRYLSQLVFFLSGGKFRKGLDSVYFLEHVAYYNLKSITSLMDLSGFTLAASYFTSTDLNKYRFSLLDRWIAGGILFLGKCLRMENRLVALFKKR
jgi:SAM-dependent methyltransferase